MEVYKHHWMDILGHLWLIGVYQKHVKIGATETFANLAAFFFLKKFRSVFLTKIFHLSKRPIHSDIWNWLRVEALLRELDQQLHFHTFHTVRVYVHLHFSLHAYILDFSLYPSRCCTAHSSRGSLNDTHANRHLWGMTLQIYDQLRLF